MATELDPTKLRSYSWFNGKEYYNFSRRANVRALGISREAFHGKPVIGICNTYSELTPCNAHFRTHADSVKKGVLEAGGCSRSEGQAQESIPG